VIGSRALYIADVARKRLSQQEIADRIATHRNSVPVLPEVEGE
jgi:hypothetical protein